MSDTSKATHARLQLALLVVCGVLLVLVGTRLVPIVEQNISLTQEITRKQAELKSLQKQVDDRVATLVRLNSLIDNNNGASARDILSELPFWEQVSVSIRAQPTGRRNRFGPTYQLTLFLQGVSAALRTVRQIEYYFDDPAFEPKAKIGTDLNSGFAVSYEGARCLSAVRVTMIPKEITQQPAVTNFNMCAALGW
jgi:hypothetical protein